MVLRFEPMLQDTQENYYYLAVCLNTTPANLIRGHTEKSTLQNSSV